MATGIGDVGPRRRASTPTLIGSVQRALRVLEEVASSSRPLPAKAIARRLDLALPTTYHLLRTLAHEGYVDRLSDGSWALGARAEQLRHGDGEVGAIARSRPVFHEAATGIGSTLYIARWHDGAVEMVDIIDVPGCRRIELWVGIHDAAHATALGKAVLHGLAETERRTFVHTHDLPAFTRHTTTDRARLLDELERAPTALDREEYTPGIACIAAPFRLGDDPAAIAIAVAPNRLEAALPTAGEQLQSYALRAELAAAAV